ncbi:MAG: PD40 domain-containing protein [Akkermansiaceae bacterium]|nr:PD40 domain-containing protein [Armatimonadota bacterium]
MIRSPYARAAALALMPLVLLPATPAVSRETENNAAVFARFPALSPDAKTVAFSYQGDIWSVPASGTEPARRITAHPAYDSRPAFSPDGSQIAFQSTRYNGNDVFVMPATGGEPRRVTYFSGGSTLQGWTSDGKSLLVAQTRELQRRGPAMYIVSADGKGRARPTLSVSNMISGTLAHDNERLIFARGSGDWERRGYRGAANADIYLYKRTPKQFVRITDFDGQDLWPQVMPNGKTVIYVSERDGTYNLYQQTIGSGTARQLTHYSGDGVRFPSLSANGSAIVYEHGDRIGLLSLNVTKTAPKIVPIKISADDKITAEVTETRTNGVTNLAVSPDNEQIALEIQGDIFVADRDGGRATRLTEAASRDGDVSWSADGKTLVYVSNRDGRPELYSVTSADTGEARLSRSLKRSTARITQNAERESNTSYSPDGKRFAFLRGDGTLMIADANSIVSAKPRITSTFPIGSYRWSPDSRHIVFSQEDEEFNSEIFVVTVDGDTKPVNVSMHPRNDSAPTWSPDGNKLFWTSERMDRRYDLYYVYLTKTEDERTGEEWNRMREKAKAPKKKEEGTKGDKPAAPQIPAIDFEEIETRVRRLTTLPGSETAPVIGSGLDGHLNVVYSSTNNAEPELTLLDFLDGGANEREKVAPPRRISSGSTSNVQWSADGKTLFFLSATGTVNSAAATGSDTKPIPFRARLSYNRRALQTAIFDEAWETLSEQFYDSEFHGSDWKALRAKYAPLAASASDPQDFYQVIRLLMGHLNSSHIGITPPALPYETASGENLPTGAIGVIWDETYQGKGLRIARVIKGSPASKAISLLRANETVSAINGTELTSTTNPDGLLADTVSERVILQVIGTDNKEREVVIEPTTYAAVRALLYEEWVEANRKRTHELSGGRIAYLHIRSMDKVSQDRFEQGLYAEAHGRNGLLIDVRDNGGGSTADYLLTMLTIPRHAFTIGRDGAPGYPQDRLPLYPWNKPAGLLINQNSYSNAEIFAHAFRTLDRGPIFGTPTFGAVISTGARRLLDGSSVRTPGRGWYNIRTGVNEEHTGAEPTVRRELSLADEIVGTDPQLTAAVKALLERSVPVTVPAPKRARYARP